MSQEKTELFVVLAIALLPGLWRSALRDGSEIPLISVDTQAFCQSALLHV